MAARTPSVSMAAPHQACLPRSVDRKLIAEAGDPDTVDSVAKRVVRQGRSVNINDKRRLSSHGPPCDRGGVTGG